MSSISATLQPTLDAYTLLCHSPFLSFVPLLPLSFLSFVPLLPLSLLSFVPFFFFFSLGDVRDELHCMRYGACVVFEDGTTFTAFQRKALEYGCSLDPVAMVRPVEEGKGASIGGWRVGGWMLEKVRHRTL